MTCWQKQGVKKVFVARKLLEIFQIWGHIWNQHTRKSQKQQLHPAELFFPSPRIDVKITGGKNSSQETPGIPTKNAF